MNKHHPTAALREMETQTLNLVSTEFCSVQTAGTFVNLCFSFLVFLMIFEADFPQCNLEVAICVFTEITFMIYDK